MVVSIEVAEVPGGWRLVVGGRPAALYRSAADAATGTEEIVRAILATGEADEGVSVSWRPTTPVGRALVRTLRRARWPRTTP